MTEHQIGYLAKPNYSNNRWLSILLIRTKKATKKTCIVCSGIFKKHPRDLLYNYANRLYLCENHYSAYRSAMCLGCA